VGKERNPLKHLNDWTAPPRSGSSAR